MNAIKISATWQERGGTPPHQRDNQKTKRAQSASRVFTNPTVKLVQCAIPEPKAREVLIRVRACGICGSDVAMANVDQDGYVKYPFMMKSPIIPGHEFAGEIIEVGREVLKTQPNLVPGTPVTALCVNYCGTCIQCIDGEFDLCEYAEERGFTIDGAMAEYCVVDMRHVRSLASLLEPTKTKRLWRPAPCTEKNIYLVGGLIEPLSGVYKAIEMSQFPKGGAVLITGTGPIGNAAMLVFRALGAGKIFVADIALPRLRRAAILGADGIVDMGKEKLSTAILEATNGKGVKVIFEASGAAEKFWDEIISLLENTMGTTVVFFGQSKKEVPINPQLLIQRFHKFIGSHGHTKIWPIVIARVAAGRIKPLPMITRTIKLSEAPRWLKELPQRPEELKVTITDFTR